MKVLIIFTPLGLLSVDLIGWNRLRNNEHQRRYRSIKISPQFLDQIQQFYSSQGKNGQFLKARRELDYQTVPFSYQVSTDAAELRPKLRKFRRKL